MLLIDTNTRLQQQSIANPTKLQPNVSSFPFSVRTAGGFRRREKKGGAQIPRPLTQGIAAYQLRIVISRQMHHRTFPPPSPLSAVRSITTRGNPIATLRINIPISFYLIVSVPSISSLPSLMNARVQSTSAADLCK